MTTRAVVVVPVRSFAAGKSRLGGRLDPPARSELLQRMAERVVFAAEPLPVVVVSSAPEVRDWARRLDVAVLDDPGSLDDAAAAGHDWAAGQRAARVVIAHADLPLARALPSLAVDAGRPVAVAVPCHRDDGTPVLSLPTGHGFRFSYGPGSFRRHAAEAHRHGLAFRVRRDPFLGRDVDMPDDLAGLAFPPAPALV